MAKRGQVYSYNINIVWVHMLWHKLNTGKNNI
jgi:hypothetical protein